MDILYILAKSAKVKPTDFVEIHKEIPLRFPEICPSVDGYKSILAKDFKRV
jgi:hypothetical protein